MFPFPIMSMAAAASVIVATSISTASVGICIVGGSKQVEYTVDPEGGVLTDINYTTTAPAVMTVSTTGLMTFVSEGGFDVGMTAKNSEGATLSDSSGGYTSELGMYTPSLSAMDVGTTQTMVAEISPTGAETLPGMVVQYYSNDITVATVNPDTGVITGVGDGDCRIGCTATYQGVVSATDSSYLAVNAVAAKPVVMDYDLTQETLPTGVQANGGNYFARSSGDTLVTTNTLVAPLEYIGATPVGRRVTANTASQTFINNALTSASPWVKTNLTVAASAVNSPVGTTANTFKLTPNTTSGKHIVAATYTNATNVAAGSNWSASVFLKAGGITKAKLRLTAGTEVTEGTFDLTAGTFTGSEANIVSMGNGWYRAILHKTVIVKQSSIICEIIALDATDAETFAGNGTNNLVAWLPQLELAPTGKTSKAGSPYICTSSTTLGGVSLTIPMNGHTGVDVYYSNGDIVRDVFSGTATNWTISYSNLYDWGSVFITGLKYYD